MTVGCFFVKVYFWGSSHTVDGSEILHHLMRSSSYYLQVFLHPRWCRVSSINTSGFFKLHGTYNSQLCKCFFKIQDIWANQYNSET